MTTATITVKMPKIEKERLNQLALRYGLSLPELSHRILKEVASEIQEESFDGYDNPRQLRRSFARAIRDYRAGRVSARL